MRSAISICVVAALFVAGCDYASPLNDDTSLDRSEAAADGASAGKKGPSTETRVVVTLDEFATNLSDVVAEPASWMFYNDLPDGIDISLGTIITGPAPTPTGIGSATISVTGLERYNVATYQFSGTPLASITRLAYSTYNPSAGNGGAANRAAYLQFNVDFDGSDTWQRRLVYVPNKNGTVVQNQWQEWDAISGGNAKWSLSGGNWPGTTTSGTTLKTWSQILSEYPGVRVRVTDSFLGLRVGEPYANGYTENIDKIVFGTAAGTTIFDFEPAREACLNGGWQQSVDPVFANQGQCIQYNNTSK